MPSALLEFPGLIDCHVHFREPGLTHKATMAGEALSARRGGVRTVCDMPNTIPPTVTIEALRDKIACADAIADCDIRFFFGVTEYDHLTELTRAWRDPDLCRRLAGVKIFFDHSTGNQGAAMDVIRETFKVCAEEGIPLAAHCEDAGVNGEARAIIEKSHPGTADVSFHSLLRPCASEAKAVADAVALAQTYGTPLHIAHLSTAEGVGLVRQAKEEGAAVTCETTPHHLFLTVDDYEVLGPFGKMNPPLRTADERQALWDAIADGTVDCIASDHAPHTAREKECGDPLGAPSGVPGTETVLPLLLTVAAGGWPHPSSPRPNIPLFHYSNIQTLCFTNPNRIFSLHADAAPRVTIDPDAAWVIRGKDLHSQCGWTPYEGWAVKGKIVS